MKTTRLATTTDTGITFQYLQVTQIAVTRTSPWKGYKPEVSHELAPENEPENEPKNELSTEITTQDSSVDMDDIFSTSSVDVAEDKNQNAQTIDLANYFSGINKPQKRPKCANNHLFVNKQFSAW